jgi:hypothetical protein
VVGIDDAARAVADDNDDDDDEKRSLSSIICFACRSSFLTTFVRTFVRVKGTPYKI